MTIQRSIPLCARAGQRGAALLLSLLVLFVLVAILWQIHVITKADEKVAWNDLGITNMDLAVESAMHEVGEMLAADGEAAAGGDAGGMPGGAMPGPEGGGDGGETGDPGGGGGEQASDSREDEWARPQRTEINKIKLRIFVQDEDSKYNVLNMLNADEEEAEAAFERVARILDFCRDGTAEDIDRRDAEEMAVAMRDHMQQRGESYLPRPGLLTDDEENEDLGLPLSLRELVVLEQFDESMFRDYRDEDGVLVHSIGSFLTVWTSLTTAGEATGSGAGGGGGGGGSGRAGSGPPTGSGTGTGTGTTGGGGGGGGGTAPGSGSTTTATAGGQLSPSPDPDGEGIPSTDENEGGAAAEDGGATSSGGYAVNVNTAPVSVLKALFDDRDVSTRFWDDVVEYRNLEEEDEQEEDADTEPVYDEYGDEIVPLQIFDSVDELSEVDDFDDLEPEWQSNVTRMLTTQSNVFSVYITARRPTAAQNSDPGVTGGERRDLEESELSTSLVRTVRAVFWRRTVDSEVELVPIIRWELIDYVPYEVLDYPDDER